MCGEVLAEVIGTPTPSRRYHHPVAVRLTKHAEAKLELLARHGVIVTLADVVAAVTDPDVRETDGHPWIAQRRFGERHVLRVVYRQEGSDVIVITVYPGRRSRYEHSL